MIIYGTFASFLTLLWGQIPLFIRDAPQNSTTGKNINEVHRSERRKSKHWVAHVQADVWHTQHIHLAENNKLLSQIYRRNGCVKIDFHFFH